MQNLHILPRMARLTRRSFYNLDAILQDAGKITAEFAKRFAESEFEKYRIIQDKLFQSDFDRLTHGELPSFEIE